MMIKQQSKKEWSGTHQHKLRHHQNNLFDNRIDKNQLYWRSFPESYKVLLRYIHWYLKVN